MITKIDFKANGAEIHGHKSRGKDACSVRVQIKNGQGKGSGCPQIKKVKVLGNSCK